MVHTIIHLLLAVAAIVAVAAVGMLSNPRVAFAAWSADMYHVIQVLDSETARPVPMVNLTTTWHSAHMTDSNGIVAFYDPIFMGSCAKTVPDHAAPAAAVQGKSTVWFSVLSDGYVFEGEDGWGGVSIDVRCGGWTTINVVRTNIAERLYRISGAGIYKDTIVAGLASKVAGLSEQFVLERGLLARGSMVGQDSVMTAIHRGKMYWFYGDTNRHDFLLGNFHATGAVTPIPDPASLKVDIEYGLNLTYFVDGTFVKSIAPVPPMDQPTWIHDVVSLPDTQGGEPQMLATYLKPAVNNHDESRGMLRWDEQTQQFIKIKEIDSKTQNVWPTDGGHALIVGSDLYFGQPYPMVRTKATVSGYLQWDKYRAYTPLVEGTSAHDIDNVEIERDGDGKVVYGWKEDTSPLSAWQMLQLIGKGVLHEDEAFFMQMRSVDTGRRIWAHGGTVAWNEYRNCYIMVFVEADGETSFLGDLWYSEASAPHGPWVWAKKIVSHKGQTFYNPRHHPEFDKLNGRIIYFEGTYVNTYTSQHPTSHYDYNQQMYKLDLDRVKLPRAVYMDPETGMLCMQQCSAAVEEEGVHPEFYAYQNDDDDDDDSEPSLVPVYVDVNTGSLRLSSTIAEEPLFFAFDPNLVSTSWLASRRSILMEVNTIDGATVLAFKRPRMFDAVVFE